MQNRIKIIFSSADHNKVVREQAAEHGRSASPGFHIRLNLHQNFAPLGFARTAFCLLHLLPDFILGVKSFPVPLHRLQTIRQLVFLLHGISGLQKKQHRSCQCKKRHTAQQHNICHIPEMCTDTVRFSACISLPAICLSVICLSAVPVSFFHPAHDVRTVSGPIQSPAVTV